MEGNLPNDETARIYSRLNPRRRNSCQPSDTITGHHTNENNQIQHRNMPEDISDILGTRVYQGYVETPLQTLDGIIVNQPKRFLPLTEEAKQIAKEIRIEKINEQWAGIPREQLLNQSFNDQLNLIQILEQLAPIFILSLSLSFFIKFFSFWLKLLVLGIQ